MENPLDLAKLIGTVERQIKSLPTLSDECSICRVSPHYRALNPKAYTPTVVCIGPLHHGKNEYRAMEDHKWRYLSDFLQRCSLPIGEYIQIICDLERRLRNNYAELSSDDRAEFLQIMAADGAFLMEYFLKETFEDWSVNDGIWGRPQLLNDIRFDMLLIENQVPFFLLETLFELYVKSNGMPEVSLIKMIRNAIVGATGWKWLMTDNIEAGTRVSHLVDFIAICLKPTPTPIMGVGEEINIQTSPPPTISNLHRVGVRFEAVASNSFYNLRFDRGILQMPILELMGRTGDILSNIQGFEQCQFANGYMNAYTNVMDMLINTGEDIDLLVQNGCIINRLHDNICAAEVINTLGKSSRAEMDKFYYKAFVHSLNVHYQNKRHRWKATLKQKYFSNPWSTLSVVAAGILLILTLLRTIFSYLQLH